MSQGLKALERICSQACTDRDELFYLKHLNCKKAEENEEYCPYCTGCLYCSGNKNYKAIEKELRAFEIIKEKKVDIRILLLVDGLYKYNNFDSIKRMELTQEEFDLLKEVLG